MSAFVVMSGDVPVAVATTLEAAKAETVRRATQYGDQSNRELVWREHFDGLRLMSRRGGMGRFSWTRDRVVEVEEVTE